MRILLAPLLFAPIFIGMLPAAHAAAIPTDMLGTWWQDPACAAGGLMVAFTPQTMEVLQDGERRTLVDVDAATRLASLVAGEVELRTTAVEYVRQPNAAPPLPGDVLRFRRQGDTLRVVAVTMQGKLVALPNGGPLFHRCQR
jgi:hypothetical protein